MEDWGIWVVVLCLAVAVPSVITLAWDTYTTARLRRRLRAHYGFVPTIQGILDRIDQARQGPAQRSARPRRRPSALSRYHRELGITPGYVYLLRDGEGLYKIGLSRNVPERVRTLQRRHPTPLTIEHLIASQHTHRLEHALHRRFARRNVTGEWFRLTPQDVAFIRQIPPDLDLDGIAAQFPEVTHG